MFTDEEIRRKQEICDAPVVTESGECFVVKSVELYLDGKCAEVIDEHAYYLTAAQIRDALHESAEKIGAMPAVSPSKVVDIVDHRLSEKEEED